MKLHLQVCLFASLLFPLGGNLEESHAEDPPTPTASSGEGQASPAKNEGVPAPQESPEQSGTNSAETKQEGKVDAPSGNPNEPVEPLDAWDAKEGGDSEGKKSNVIVAPTPSQAEGGDATEEGAGEGGEEQAIQAESAQSEEVFSISKTDYDPITIAQHPRRIQLNKKQKFRLERARRVRWSVIQEQRKALELPGEDPRGAAEIRLCSVNFNNYGTKEDYKRIFKAAQLNQRARIGNSIAKTIQSAKCDVVACQGILGLDVATAKEALENFAKRLSKEAGTEWMSYLGTNNSLIVYNGFLVKKSAGTVEGTNSYHTLKFPLFGAFSLKGFSRGPLQLMLRVPGRNGAPSRLLFLISADLRDTFLPKSLGPERERIQMAESMRTTIASLVRAHADDDDPPLMALLVDRVAPGWSPTSLVFDGRTRLIDFTMNGGCTLQDEKKLSCSQAKQHVKELVGLTTEGVGADLPVKSKTVDGKTVKYQVIPSAEALKKIATKLERRESEIYIPVGELDLALERFGHVGKYKAGVAKVANGLPASPLVWAELNW